MSRTRWIVGGLTPLLAFAIARSGLLWLGRMAWVARIDFAGTSVASGVATRLGVPLIGLAALPHIIFTHHAAEPLGLRSEGPLLAFAARLALVVAVILAVAALEGRLFRKGGLA